jgi:glucose/mannose-6-phosphate isomerase
MLDDMNVLGQHDSEKTLDSSVLQFEQTTMDVTIGYPDHDERVINRIVSVGMGGSALASELAQTWLDDELKVPFDIVKGYSLPSSVNEHTLVILNSCSGNTEEVLEALDTATQQGAQLAIIAGGGALAERAASENISHVILPPIRIQPRMLTFIQVRAIVELLGLFGVIDAPRHLEEIAGVHDWLKTETSQWAKEVPTDKNYAKQLALLAVGKTPVFYGGQLTKSIAYKWKISWNENAKNTAFWNQYPEFNHNEFIGWSSHPVEKPFAIFDLVSNFEHPRILKRFELSDRLLSGLRPKAVRVDLKGESLLGQMLWAHVLADFTSIYVGILNGVDPGPVPLVTKLKQELS